MAKLTLSLIDGTYAVVRLAADAIPPAWLWESNFYSLTKTEEELSIVCNQIHVPSDICSDEQRCESNWGLFRVEGPLDFGLTGILNKLTTPLAKAGISIFAISTYDTDYILVKQGRVIDAGYAWILAGHVVNGLPESRRPQDEPVTMFESDPFLQRVFDLTRGGVGEETFGLVLVAGWEPSDAIQSAYNKGFLPAVQKCFHESDWKSPLPEEIPNVYFYPSRHLHVTVATTHAFSRPADDESTQKIQQQEWTVLVKAASQREGWPVEPLQLSLDTVQIGKRAGIIVWKDLTGGIDRMRICIQAEADDRQNRLIRAGIDPDTLSIPSILHSTFLRMHKAPETPVDQVQENLEKYVTKHINTFFPDPITVSQAKFVCERIPYMHFDDDERHVLATFSLGSSHS